MPPSTVFSNRVTKLFNIKYPIIQAGMVWTSGWRLASAVRYIIISFVLYIILHVSTYYDRTSTCSVMLADWEFLAQAACTLTS